MTAGFSDYLNDLTTQYTILYIVLLHYISWKNLRKSIVQDIPRIFFKAEYYQCSFCSQNFPNISQV